MLSVGMEPIQGLGVMGLHMVGRGAGLSDPGVAVTQPKASATIPSSPSRGAAAWRQQLFLQPVDCTQEATVGSGPGQEASGGLKGVGIPASQEPV